jgi:predicted transcriptional regulator of viral defense system
MNKKTNYNELYKIAESQSGFFTTKQAKKAGYSWERLSSLSKQKKFQRIERGIYRIMLFPSSQFEDFFIAVLKSGEDSVVSHESALYVYDLSDILPDEIHITIPKNRSRRREGIKYHICRINKNEITSYQGLPITTVERTIADIIRTGMDIHLVNQSIKQAIERGMITRQSLLDETKNFSKTVRKIIHSGLKMV